jgi:protein-disulfide isomerase
MHDLIFRNQSRIRREDLLRYAGQLGLDPRRFESALDNPVHQTTIASDRSEGQRLGVDGTPTFFINGRRVVGALPYPEFQKILDEELKRLETKRP